MKIAYNPEATALTAAPSNNDITFDLAGKAIYAKGVKFEGMNTTYSVFKKHTSDNSGGYDGLVPVPSYTTTTIRYLREDGNWEVPIMSEAVTDLGTEGNHVTWTKNNIVNKLTVPYATIAGSANSVAWGNITGKPSSFTPSSHTHTYIESKANYTFTASTLPNSFDWGVSAGFVADGAGYGSYGSVLTVRTYTGGGGTLLLYAPYSNTYGGSRLKARFGNYDSNSGNSWTTLKEIAWTSDIPTKTSQLTNDSGYLTSLPSHDHSYLPLSGGTMTSTANISWADRGAWGNASATYPYSYGGLSWSGTSDWIKIYAKEAGSDALNLVFDFGDDSGHYITFRDNGTEYTMLHSGNIGSQSVNYANSAGYAGSASNADTVDGYHATIGDNKPWGTIPAITTGGYMDVGRHFEFHYDNTTGSDYSTILMCTGNYSNIVNLPSASGTLALTSLIPTSLPANGGTANYINYTTRADKGNGTAQFCQYSGETNNPTNDWYSHIIMNHNNSAGYYTEIATCFHSDSVYFRRQSNGTTYAWKTFAWTSDIPTVTNYYWANVKVSSSSNPNTSPTFASATVTDRINATNYVFLNPNGSGIYLNSNSLNWHDGSVYKQSLINFTSDGKVGIDTTSPAYKLDVVGSAGFGTGSGCDVFLRRSGGYSYINATSSLALTVNNYSGNIAVGIATDKHATFYGSQTLYGLTSTCNKANDAEYMSSALQIREYNFGGAQSDTWAIAPRLSWHWSGRVQTQIGLSSSGDLKLSKDNFATSYLLLHSGNIGSQSVNYANSAGISDYLKIHDIRNNNYAPNSTIWPLFNIRAWFNNTGTPNGDWWSGITVKGWTNDYNVWLLASTATSHSYANFGLFFRTGNGSSWTNWKNVVTSESVNNIVVTSSLPATKTNNTIYIII